LQPQLGDSTIFVYSLFIVFHGIHKSYAVVLSDEPYGEMRKKKRKKVSPLAKETKLLGTQEPRHKRFGSM